MSEENSNKPSKVKLSVVERRQQVLETLIRLLNSEQGMSRISVKRLAAEIGISEGALYRYYEGKQQMFEALIEEIEKTLQQNIITNRQQGTLKADVHGVAFTLVEFGRKNPGVTRILTGHALMFEEQLLKVRVAKFFDSLEIQFFNLLQRHKAKRQFAVGDERELASFLVNFCEGQLLHLVRSNFHISAHQHFEKQWQFIVPYLQVKEQ